MLDTGPTAIGKTERCVRTPHIAPYGRIAMRPYHRNIVAHLALRISHFAPYGRIAMRPYHRIIVSRTQHFALSN